MALICLLFVGSCKKDQTDSKSHTLESYKGTDRLVLDVINELKKPENSDLVKRLDAKEEIDWKNHQTLITSSFLDGVTLRFKIGKQGDYIDVRLNTTNQKICFSEKQTPLKEQSKAKNSTKLASVSPFCNYKVGFTYSVNYYDIQGCYNLFVNQLTTNLNNMGYHLVGTEFEKTNFSNLPIHVEDEIKRAFQNSLGTGVCMMTGSIITIDVRETCPSDPDGGGGGDGNGGGNGGGPTYSGNPNDPYLYEVTSVKDGIDLQKRMECFKNIPDNGAAYTAKLCSDLADDNDPLALIGPDRVGHSFLILTKTNGSNSVNLTFGFYPKTGIKSIFGTTGMGVPVASQIEDDGKSAHQYNASIAMPNMSKLDFDAMLNSAKSLAQTMKYDINDFNCTDFALQVFNSGRAPYAQIIVEDWMGDNSGLNYGRTPEGLYKTINQMKRDGNANAKTTRSYATPSTICN